VQLACAGMLANATCGPVNYARSGMPVRVQVRGAGVTLDTVISSGPLPVYGAALWADVWGISAAYVARRFEG
jgi:hypothetical protein